MFGSTEILLLLLRVWRSSLGSCLLPVMQAILERMPGSPLSVSRFVFATGDFPRIDPHHAPVDLFAVFYSFGWTPLQGLYPSEVLSFENRAKGLSLQTIAAQVFGLINTFGMPSALAALKWKSTFLTPLPGDFIMIAERPLMVQPTSSLPAGMRWASQSSITGLSRLSNCLWRTWTPYLLTDIPRRRASSWLETLEPWSRPRKRWFCLRDRDCADVMVGEGDCSLAHSD
jgi:hypothetical protein